MTPRLVLLISLAACAVCQAAVPQEQKLMRDILDTFVAANDIPGALETARKGRSLYPSDPFWLNELGELSVWNGDPRGALAAFKELLEFQNSVQLRRRVAALAIGLKDYETALYALELDLAANDLDKVDDLIYIYEQLGKPEKAAELIEKYSQRFNSPAGLAKAIELHTNLGDSEGAEKLYKAMVGRFGISTATAQGYAELLAAKRDLERAFSVLRKAEHKAGKDDTAFWNIYGDLAWHFGDVKAAVKAAEILDAAGAAREPEYDRLTAYYKASGRARDGEQTSQKAWLRTGKPYFLLSWLNSMAGRGDFGAVRSVMAGLSAPQEQQAGATRYYWTMKAMASSDGGDQAGALQAYESALAMDPDSEEVKTQILWFLAGRNMARDIRKRLTTLAPGGDEDPDKQLALAYAYLAADEPDAARARTAAYRRLRGDGAGTMAEAAVAEAGGDIEAAIAKRFSRWLELSDHGRTLRPENAAEFMNLCAAFCSAPRFMEELARLSPSLSGTARNEAMLARASAAGDADAAGVYASELESVPVWYRLSRALSDYDTEELRALLGHDYYSLPPRDRITALEYTGETELARSETITLLNSDRSDTALNLKAAELLRSRPSAVFSPTYRKRKVLETSGVTASVSAATTKSLSFSAGGSAYRRSSTSPAILLADKEDDDAWVAVSLNRPRWDSSLKAGGRDAAKRFFFAGAQFGRKLKGNSRLEFSSGYGSRADESSNLETSGMKDFISVSLSMPIRGASLRLTADDSQFFSQDRTYAGNLSSLKGELSFLDQFPGWTLSSRIYAQNASGSESRAHTGSLADSSSFYGSRCTPGSFNQYGAGATLSRYGYGLPVRRLSPYFSADYYYNDRFFGGAGGRAGMAWAPHAGRQFDIWAEYAKGYKGSGDEVKSLGLTLTCVF